MIKCYQPKPPAHRDYHPKPRDPGQPVTWTRVTAGHWTVQGATWQSPCGRRLDPGPRRR